MRNKKGFTLIELLAVIVILGLLIAIAIPSITKYITESKKKTLATTISKYVESGLVSVNNGEYMITDSNVIYAIPIECIPMERDGDNPFGEWNQVNDEYWAYVLVQYNPEDFSYNYGFSFKDSAGYGMYPVSLETMDSKGSNIKSNLDISRPRTGLASYFSNDKYWEKSGFKVDETTRIKVLVSNLEDVPGDGEDTCTLQNKGLNYKEIEEIKTRTGTLINNGSSSKVFGKDMSKTLIEEIYTLDYIDIPTDAIESWDASIQKNESIMAWTTDKDNDGLYELYLAQEGGVIAPANSSQLFYGYSKIIKMNLSNLKMNNATSMHRMFNGCSKLTELNLSNFNTSKVKDMSHMFEGCRGIINLDLSSFDTSNVTNMKSMFTWTDSLESVDLSSFKTENVTNMSHMFNGAKALKSLDLSNFNTSKVTDMTNMFYSDNKLTSLDISNFDTSNVTGMSGMFYGLGSLKSLDVSSFNTTKVTNMANMFNGLSLLTSLDVSNFDTSNVTNMHRMFNGCSKLTELNLSNFNTSKVKDMSHMFEGCRGIINLDLSSFDTSNVTNMKSMFTWTYSLESVDLSSFDFSKVTSYESMFNSVPTTSKIIVKDDTARNWIQTKFSNYKNIVTVDELQ